MKRSDFIKTTLGLFAIPVVAKIIPLLPETPVFTPKPYVQFTAYELVDRDFRRKLLAKVPGYRALDWMKEIKKQPRRGHFEWTGDPFGSRVEFIELQ